MDKEYIEREAALKELEDSGIGFCDDEPIQTRNRALKIIQNIPTADVRPVVRGRWIVTAKFADCVYALCDQCKITQVLYHNKPLTNYCPNCGADMQERKP